jgi:hypothetical protein
LAHSFYVRKEKSRNEKKVTANFYESVDVETKESVESLKTFLQDPGFLHMNDAYGWSRSWISIERQADIHEVISIETHKEFRWINLPCKDSSPAEWKEVIDRDVFMIILIADFGTYDESQATSSGVQENKLRCSLQRIEDFKSMEGSTIIAETWNPASPCCDENKDLERENQIETNRRLLSKS